MCIDKTSVDYVNLVAKFLHLHELLRVARLPGEKPTFLGLKIAFSSSFFSRTSFILCSDVSEIKLLSARDGDFSSFIGTFLGRSILIVILAQVFIREI